MLRLLFLFCVVLFLGCSGNSEPTVPENAVDEEPNLELTTGGEADEEGKQAAPPTQSLRPRD